MNSNIVQLDREEVQEIKDLLFSLINEDNQRALVIVATAKIESLIQSAAECVAGGSFGFNKNLNVLIARGLLHAEVKRCLGVLWDIRCHFAHSPNHCALDDEKSAPMMRKLHEKMEQAVSPFMEGLDQKLIEWRRELSSPRADFAGTPDMRFFAGAAHALSLYLISARLLCPKPLEPPTLDDPIFQWGP